MGWLLEFAVVNVHGRDLHVGLLSVVIVLLLASMFVCIHISKKHHLYEKETPAVDASDT